MAAWLPDCMAARLPGCLLPSAWLCLAAWLPGCLAAWLPGCLVAWLPGCLARPGSAWLGLAAWLPGCLAAWPPGRLAARLAFTVVQHRDLLIQLDELLLEGNSQLAGRPMPIERTTQPSVPLSPNEYLDVIHRHKSRRSQLKAQATSAL